MTLGKKNYLLKTILITVIILQLLCSPIQIYSQANLVEEIDHYKVYSSNYFDVTIPKNNAPLAEFYSKEIGTVKFLINYVSEYFGTGAFLSSLNSLSGKGYDLQYIDWKTIGYSDNNKTVVNFSENNLDANTSIDVSFLIFNQNTTINNYQIIPLKELFIQFNITNWIFTYGIKGIALNLIASFTSNENYVRLGPYIDFESLYYYVKLISNQNEFQVKFRPQIIIKTINNETYNYDTMFFANYNINAQESQPADFWLSVPYRSDIYQIYFGFLCSFNIESTNNADIRLPVIIGLSIITSVILIQIKRRRQNNVKY